MTKAVVIPTGYSIIWSGQYEYMQRAKETMKLVIPTTLAIIFLWATTGPWQWLLDSSRWPAWRQKPVW